MYNESITYVIFTICGHWHRAGNFKIKFEKYLRTVN